MKKRIHAAILMIVFLLVCILSPIPASAESDQDATSRLLNDLIGYLYQEEILYGDLQWALDAFERFDRERSWENLLQARAELSIARQDIANRKIDDPTLTAEDHMLFLDAGIDFSFLENSKQNLQKEVTTYLNTCSNLQTHIILSIFLEEDWKIAMQHVNVIRQITECHLQYQANQTDWILMKIGRPEVTKAFNELLEEYCPLIHAHQAMSPATPEENEASSDAILRQLSELDLEIRKVTGAQQDRFNWLYEIIDAGNWEQLSEDLVTISDTPPLLLLPEQYSASTNFQYFWTENGEIVSSPMPGSDPEKKPDVCRVTLKDISLQDVRNYQQLLSNIGLDPLSDSEEDGNLKLMYSHYGSSFSIRWKDHTMTILMFENPVLLIPTWYFLTIMHMNSNER